MRVALLTLLLVAAPAGVRAQEDLARVAASAERAWMGHDVRRLIGQGPALYLSIPGADPSLPVGRERAVILVERYLARARERGWEVRAVREVEPGHGYVEAIRRFVVVGTDDERRETVFLGYRRTGSRWALVELRIVP